MKITYIHHSSFFVETEKAFLLFDYYQGEIPSFSDDRPCYVLASHAHPDHFSPVIFSLARGGRQVIYLLSSDISRNQVPEEVPEKQVHVLEPGEVFSDGILKVETFASNDQGLAFWCSIGGEEIYHAGDLNNWFWEGDEEDLLLQRKYREELEKMRGRCAAAAFVPVDPRLGEHFYLGMDDFAKAVEARALFPMHFWGDTSVIGKLKSLPCSTAYRDRIQEIVWEGQTFQIGNPC